MLIRQLEVRDIYAVCDIIAYTLRKVNIRDYSSQYIEDLIKSHSPEIILDRMNWAHMYVACDKDRAIGCGAIAPYCGSLTESIMLTIFVLPEYQGRGIGKRILNTLEADIFFKRAERVEIPSSITACGFYRKLGYDYKNGNQAPDEAGLIRLEKFKGALAKEE